MEVIKAYISCPKSLEYVFKTPALSTASSKRMSGEIGLFSSDRVRLDLSFTSVSTSSFSSLMMSHGRLITWLLILTVVYRSSSESSSSVAF